MKIKRFEFNMFPVNCYVLSDETGEAAVIDAGCYYPEEQQRLKKYIQDNHLSVKLLLNTHLHPLGGYIKDGDRMRFGNTTLEAIHAPGHSPGGMVFYCKDSACMFSGDVLFQGSIGRADLDGGDFSTLRRSIIERLFVLPDETIVYPGHGDATSIGNEKTNNPFFR